MYRSPREDFSLQETGLTVGCRSGSMISDHRREP